MNLLITDACNRSCPYCFAQEKVALRDDLGEHSTDFISLENVQKYLDFMAASNYPVLRLLGGEPTIHPKFPEIVDMGLDAGHHVMVFTNALWSKRVLDYLARPHTQNDVSFVINVQEENERFGRETETMEMSLEIAGKRGMPGFNIYHQEFDLRFVVDLIDRFGMQRKLRLGLSNPIVGTANLYPSDKSLFAIGERLVDQMDFLEEHDVVIEFDCGWPLCMFPDERISTLADAKSSFAATCGIIIDVTPDLTAFPCFPLSGLLNVNLLDFKNRNDLVRYLNSTLSKIRHMGSKENCLACEYGRGGQCARGCAARSIGDFMAADPDFLEKLERTTKQAAAGQPA